MGPKRIFFPIIIMIFMVCTASAALFTYKPLTTLANVSFYAGGNIVNGGVGNFIGASHATTNTVYNDKNESIRQTGTTSYFLFNVVNKTKLTSYKINIWHPHDGTYTMTAQSPELINTVQTGYNNISLALPVTEGDCIGESGVGAGGTGYFANVSTGGCRYNYLSNYNINATYNWDGGARVDACSHMIIIQMVSPQVVFIGNSITAGHPGHYSYLETQLITNRTITTEYTFNQVTNADFQNMGIGGQTTTQIAARFVADVVNQHPKYAIIEGGVNDVSLGTNSSTLSNYDAMLTACDNAGIIPCVFLILPWNGGNVTQNREINRLNDQLTLKCAAHHCILLDCRPAVATNNSTTGLWTVIPSYIADDVHYLPAGYMSIGNMAANKWLSAGASYFTSGVSNGTVPLTVQFTGISNDTTSWAWDFQNDSIIDSTQRNPLYTYTTPGIYSVNLTVTNQNGTFNTRIDNYITVYPNTIFHTNATYGIVPLNVSYIDDTKNDTSELWSFGDGNTSSRSSQNEAFPQLLNLVIAMFLRLN